MKGDEVKEGIVVQHVETGGTGTVLRGGYRPRVQWHLNNRIVRTEEGLLRFIATDECSFRRAQRDKASHDWVPGPENAGVQFRPPLHKAWCWSSQEWGGVLRDSGGRIVNPFHHLERRAEEIANGCLIAARLRLEGMSSQEITDLQEETPGLLCVRAEQRYGLPRPGGHSQRTGSMSWSISWREAGDVADGSLGMCSGHTAPDEILAHMIETCEEHHREELEKMIEHTGGLA